MQIEQSFHFFASVVLGWVAVVASDFLVSDKLAGMPPRGLTLFTKGPW